MFGLALKISPLSGSSSPVISFSCVVLPAPLLPVHATVRHTERTMTRQQPDKLGGASRGGGDAPTRPTRSPFFTSQETPLSSSRPLNVCRRAHTRQQTQRRNRERAQPRSAVVPRCCRTHNTHLGDSLQPYAGGDAAGALRVALALLLGGGRLGDAQRVHLLRRGGQDHRVWQCHTPSPPPWPAAPQPRRRVALDGRVSQEGGGGTRRHKCAREPEHWRRHTCGVGCFSTHSPTGAGLAGCSCVD